MSTPSSRPAIAVAAVVVHLAMALAVVAACSPPLTELYRAWLGPVSFADEVPSPAWLAPALFALGFALYRLVSFALGRRFPLAWTWAIVIVLSASVLGRALIEPQAVAFTSLHDAPPTVQVAQILQRLQTQINDTLLKGGEVPDAAALRSSLLEGGREVWPNYLYAHLKRQPFQVVRIADATGPVDRRRPQDLAGTFYVAVAPDHRRYWLTAVVLLEDNGVRTSDLLPGANGIMVVSNTTEGL